MSFPKTTFTPGSPFLNKDIFLLASVQPILQLVARSQVEGRSELARLEQTEMRTGLCASPETAFPSILVGPVVNTSYSQSLLRRRS